MKIIKIILFFIPMALALNSNGQGAWIKIGADKDITKKLKIDANIQSRFKDFNTSDKSFLGELELKYDLPKGFDISVAYRFIQNTETKKSGIKTKLYQRWNADMSYKTKILKPIIVSYRLRYQQRFKQDEVEGLVANQNYLRNKIEFNYNNKSKLEPYISGELFHKAKLGFDEFRYSFGTEFKINKKQKIDLGFAIDQALNSADANQFRGMLSYKIKL